MKLYPALDVCADSADSLLALVDDFSPSALEERESAMRLFFVSPDARDAASAELRARGFETKPLDVSDENWARRSQDNLPPIAVGRVTIVSSARAAHHAATTAGHPPITLVIQPSMGFGTGHHSTTRLCLEALQTIDLKGARVLDVGTGSGVLAIAAARLGAGAATGIDSDADAVQAARENLDLNPDARHVTFDVADLTTTTLPRADVVTANLTGALLARSAPKLLAALRPGGSVVMSGILADERDGVATAFAGGVVVWEKREAEWVGLRVKRS